MPGPKSESHYQHNQFSAPKTNIDHVFKRNHIFFVQGNAVFHEMVLRRERLFEVMWPV